MSREHDQSRTHSLDTPSSSQHDDLQPGRTSRSALLRKPDHAVPSGLLSRRARDQNGVAEGADSAVASASTSSGSALPEMLQRKFEASLGADLSSVRVHTGSSSAAANDAVGARAYTLGNDIHFGAGQYDPSSPSGEHLLAHEVAHTVQQGSGAQRAQFKLEVSSPGDALEHEADRAADAMVQGTAASVSFGSGVQRKIMREAEAHADSAGIDKVKIEIRERPLLGEEGKDLGYVTLKGTLSGSVSYANHKHEEKGKKEEKDEKGGVLSEPAETELGMKKGGTSLGGAKDLEMGWFANPKMESEVGLDPEGLHLKVAVGLEHEGVKLAKGTFGPFGLSLTGIKYDQKSGWTCGEIKASVAASTTGTYFGKDLTVALTLSFSAQPNWKLIASKLGELAAETLTAEMGAAALAIAAPLAAFGGGVVMWARAGHEFDGLESRINSAKARCRAVAYEAVTGKHVPMNIPFVGDVNNSSVLALQARMTAASVLGIPEAAVIAAGQKSSVLADSLADLIWAQNWPDLKAQLLKEYMGAGDHELARKFLNAYSPSSIEKMGQKL